MLTVTAGAAFAMAQSPERHPLFEPVIPKGESQDGSNLFLNSKATASGTFENFNPGLAVDGKVEGNRYWCSENLPVWHQIDMGQEQALGAIQFWPYWEDGRIYKYKIEGSTDGKNWKVLVDQSANSISGTEDGNLFTFNPVKVRYVKTTILDNSRGKVNGGHIVEIKGYAKHDNAELAASAFSTEARIPASGAPDMSNALQGITGKAWRGERVLGQIGLWSGQDISQIALNAPDLKGPNGASIPVKASFVRFTTAKGKPCADIIDPVKQVDLPGGTTRTVWVSIDVPAKATPGIYKGEVMAKGANAKVVKVPVAINVLPHVLPPPSKWKCHIDLWQHPHSVARWHNVEPWSDEHLALMKPPRQMLADTGQKPITCSLLHDAWNEPNYDWWAAMIEWIKKPDGTMTYNYKDFDKWVEFMLKDVGLDGDITCYTMIPWSLKLRYYDQAKGAYEIAPLKPGDASYEALWGPFLKDFREHVRSRGWLNKVCIGIDERPDHMVKAAKAIIAKYAPEFRIVSAVDRPSSITEDIYDFSVTFNHSNSTPKELMDKRRSEGRKTTFYVCVYPARPNTFTISRLAESSWLGYYAAANYFDGILRWAYNSWNRNPFEKTDFGNWPAGDCFLVYPGGRSSLRFEKFRDGVEEYEKIMMLREQAKSPKASPQFRQAVEEMNKTLAELYTIPKGGGDQHAADNVKAGQAVDKAASLLAK